MKLMDPLHFRPIIKRALWGGTRLNRELGKLTEGASDASESWEVCDLPGIDVSVVARGPLAGTTLRKLMQDSAVELLGRHRRCSQFPLLIKFLDAAQQLSVQVHPATRRDPATGEMQVGKAECWTVLAAAAGACMYLGLKAGVGMDDLSQAIAQNQMETVLHRFCPQVGDFIYLPPGTVHALGGGLLIAEIQQPSDLTYRLSDWGRVDSHGRPRPLHVEQALGVVDFQSGPIRPRRPTELGPGRQELVATHYFCVHRHRGSRDLRADDGRMHILVALAGTVRSLDDGSVVLEAGQTMVVPAACGELRLSLSPDAVLLDAFLPDEFEAL